jgi:para-aminobenzoate synthetase component 1
LCTLITHGAETQVCPGNNTYVSKQDPFTLVKQQLTAQKAFPEVPFNGGAIGYFAYDLGRQLEKIPKLTVDAEHIPDMAVGVYQWA